MSNADDVEIVHLDPDAASGALAPATELPTVAAGLTFATPPDFPAQAEIQPDGTVLLTLLFPKTFKIKDASGQITSDRYERLHFKRLTGAKMKTIRAAASDDFLATTLAACAENNGQPVTLGRARLLDNAMDPIDQAATVAVYRFLTVPIRTTGS